MKQILFSCLLTFFFALGIVGGSQASDSHSHSHSSDGHSQHKAAHTDGDMIKAGDLMIDKSFLRATPPNAKVAAGYLLIKNMGDSADRLLGGKTEFAARVEVHTMKMDGDVMKMRKLPDGLEIPAGGMVHLKPGGDHLMFMKLDGGLKKGEMRSVTLHFEKAGMVKIIMPVAGFGAKQADHSGHGDHSNHGTTHE